MIRGGTSFYALLVMKTGDLRRSTLISKADRAVQSGALCTQEAGGIDRACNERYFAATPRIRDSDSHRSVDGLVSGIKNPRIKAASRATDAILRNTAV
jgi:hypothetical protein